MLDLFAGVSKRCHCLAQFRQASRVSTDQSLTVLALPPTCAHLKQLHCAGPCRKLFPKDEATPCFGTSPGTTRHSQGKGPLLTKSSGAAAAQTIVYKPQVDTTRCGANLVHGDGARSLALTGLEGRPSTVGLLQRSSPVQAGQRAASKTVACWPCWSTVSWDGFPTTS